MKNSEKEIQDIDYSMSPLWSPKYIIGYVLICVIVIGTHLANSNILAFLNQTSYKINSRCTIQTTTPHFSLFMPKVYFDKITIPSQCLNKSSKNIVLEKPIIHFNFVSFSPLGFKFVLETVVLGQSLELDLIAGFSDLSILIENKSNNINTIQLRDLNDFTSPVRLDGELIISTIFATLSYKGVLSDLAVNVASKNLVLPAQNIKGFNLKVLNINKLLIQMNKLNNNKFHLEKFIIGDDKSPIIGQFAGEIIVNKKNFAYTGLQIGGELKVSDSMLEENFLLKALLDQFDKKDKFYQIQVDGSITAPNFTSKR